MSNLGIVGKYHPVIMLSGGQGTGKTSCVQALIRALPEKRFVILTAVKIQYEQYMDFFKAEFHGSCDDVAYIYPEDWEKFLDDIENKAGSIMVLDDVMNNFFWQRSKKLVAHVRQSMRKLKQMLILVTQGISRDQLPKRLVPEIRFLVLSWTNSHSVALMGEMLDSKTMARALKRDILRGLGEHEFVGVDVRMETYARGINRDAVKNLKSMLNDEWKGEQPIPTRKPKISTKSVIIIKNSKKEQSKKLMLEGKTDEQICGELNMSAGTLQVYRHQFYKEDKDFKGRYMEIKKQRGVKVGRPVEITMLVNAR